MARSTGSTTRKYRHQKDDGTAIRPVTDQPTPFVGLLVAPFIALLITWITHYAIRGWEIGDWEVNGNVGYLGLAVSVATLGAGAVAYAAWHFSDDRPQKWRYGLTISAAVVGGWLPVLIWNGPNRYLATFFVLIAWIVAAVWAIPRLRVLQRDPRDDDRSSDDSLIRDLGLEGYRHLGKPEVRFDETGEPDRIKVRIKHRFGGTRSKLQGALENIVSAVDGPEGLSRVTRPANGKASESEMVIVLKDPFVGRIPNPGPSKPGGKATDPAHIGSYDDGEPVIVMLCGGVHPVTGEKLNPSNYVFVGMSRAGKTVTENRLLLDHFITRRGATILYMNKAKGGQDVGPIIAGVEAAVITDDRNSAKAAVTHGVIPIMKYRQAQLAKYGISAWTLDKCFLNPPTHTLKGEPVPMEPMPALVVHMGESDVIMEEAPEESTFVASKGLSLGIILGLSQQRIMATQMPTDLRQNIGTVFCFGTGDDYSHNWVLSEPTIKAGAHPEHWKARKPGQFYMEALGVDESQFPVPAKGIGDTDDDALYGNMRKLAEEWGPRMDRLDSGSAQATGGWWELQVRKTDLLRDELTPAPAQAAPPAPTPTPTTPHPETPMTPDPTITFEVGDPHEIATLEARQDIEETTHVEGRAIYGDLIEPDPDDPDYLDRVRNTDPDAPIPTSPDDGFRIREDKPDAATPEEAQVKFDAAVRAALDNPEFREFPGNPGDSAVVRVHQLQKLYPFRARSWFSTMLAAMADGGRACPPGIRIEHTDDPRPGRNDPGWYRIIRLDPPSPNGHKQ